MELVEQLCDRAIRQLGVLLLGLVSSVFSPGGLSTEKWAAESCKVLVSFGVPGIIQKPSKDLAMFDKVGPEERKC